ncbi:unnamed protein product [Dicrocoelium dendriticum]|nr:unnamed protein product [Dicrocoelium dendriticum]
MMAPTTTVQNISLEEYLHEFRTIAEEPIFRTTQKGLELELSEQRHARDSIEWVSRGILPEHTHILADLQNLQESIEENEAGLHYLAGITELEKLYSSVSTWTSSRALDLSMKVMQSTYSAHDLTPEVEVSWDNIQKYAELANVHLRHALEYHKFYYRAKLLKTKITETTENICEQFRDDHWEYCDGTPREAKILSDILKQSFEEFRQQTSEMMYLNSQAKSVVPIYMRTQPLAKEVRGVMLCDYDVGDINYRAGDQIVVLRNVVPFDTLSNSLEPSSTISDVQMDRQVVTHMSENTSTETIEIIDMSGEDRLDGLDQSSSVAGFDRTISEGSGLDKNVTPFWCIRGLEDSEERTVPAVCVWITEHDTDADITTSRLQEELLENWNIAIDELFTVACYFLKQFLNKIIDSGGVCVSDSQSLLQLFDLIEECFPVLPWQPYNKELASLLEKARIMWTKVPTDELENGEFSLKRGEIAQYTKIYKLLITPYTDTHTTKTTPTLCHAHSQALLTKYTQELHTQTTQHNHVDAASQHHLQPTQTPLIDVNKQLKWTPETAPLLQAHTHSILHTTPLIHSTTNKTTEHIQLTNTAATQTTTTKSSTQSVQHIQATPTTPHITNTSATYTTTQTPYTDTHTTKTTPTLCHAHSQQLTQPIKTSTTIVKHADTHTTTTKYAHAASQHHLQPTQTPLIDVNKQLKWTPETAPLLQAHTHSILHTTPLIHTTTNKTTEHIQLTNTAATQTTTTKSSTQSVQHIQATPTTPHITNTSATYTTTQTPYTYRSITKTASALFQAHSHLLGQGIKSSTAALRHADTHTTATVFRDAAMQHGLDRTVTMLTGDSMELHFGRGATPLVHVQKQYTLGTSSSPSTCVTDFNRHIFMSKAASLYRPILVSSSSRLFLTDSVCVTSSCCGEYPVPQLTSRLRSPIVCDFGYPFIATRPLLTCADSFTQTINDAVTFVLTERFTETSESVVSNLEYLVSSESERDLQERQFCRSDYMVDWANMHLDFARFESEWQVTADEFYRTFREVGTSFRPVSPERAEVGVFACMRVTEPRVFSVQARGTLTKQIKEAGVSVGVGQRSVYCQVTQPTTYNRKFTHAGVQTDLSKDAPSEATTKLNIVATKTVESIEAISTRRGSARGTSKRFASDRDISQYYVPEVKSILCSVLERTVQYEMMEARRECEIYWTDHIQEMTSSNTGLRNPIGTAVRSGWCRAGDQEMYIDPDTGAPVLMEDAQAEGFVTMTASDPIFDNRVRTEDLPSLVLIERIAYSWRPARIIGFVDTKTGRQYTVDEAYYRGYIYLSDDKVYIYDRAIKCWISTEEAAGRGIVELEPVDQSEDKGEVIEETYSYRVFRITAVRPGGEPSAWLDPLDASSIGLFNWKTGDVATDWPARPEMPVPGCYPSTMSARFMPTHWCSLLTARKAGWLRLQAELNPEDWVLPTPMSGSDVNYIVLAKYDHLVVPSALPVSTRGSPIHASYSQSPYSPLHFSPTQTCHQRRRKPKDTIGRSHGKSRARSDAHLQAGVQMHTLNEYQDARIFAGRASQRQYLSDQQISALEETYMSQDFDNRDYGYGALI